MIIENKRNSSGRLIVCDECRRALVMTGRKISNYKIAVLCRCEAFKCCQKGAEIKEKGSVALRVKDTYICPQCGEILFSVKESETANVGFKVKCPCGMVFAKAKTAEKPKRNLGNFASLEH